MSDLHVVAVIKAKPGSEDQVGDALAALVEPTRAEDGCLRYDLFTSTVEPTTFITIEGWRSQADLDAHLKTPHVQNALGSADSLLAGAPEVHPLSPVVN
jgi:quinol monooxygenase YgiN